MIELIPEKEIYLVGLYPSPETTDFSREFIECAFRALKCVYKCNIQVIEDPKEALDLRSMPYVSIECETQYTIPSHEFTHPDKAVYLVGNSKFSHASYWSKPVDYSVHIDTPAGLTETLYGLQAAAIVLHERHLQRGTSI